ncbi:(d)CMP kinase [Amycolatopsis samaneae]|uniref:Cytidylate kinase n=1 Tax=Amycolatopsis samaneae TaxID=664691 RepID=A0ABW5GBC7_9PSEU
MAVDGPAAAGKTTASLRLARAFGMSYLESGRAYRVLAYEALRNNINPTDQAAMLALCAAVGGRSRAELLGLNRYTSGELRTTEVGRVVSAVAKIAELRTRVTNTLRAWAAGNRRSIVEGRDIGTVVFPSAALKFYLTASVETRAARRVAQEESGTYQEVLADVLRRDQADLTRAASPLRQAPDAILIDTTTLTVDQVVDRMSHRCRDVGLTVP